MKQLQWFTIILAVMTVVTQNIEEHVNPLVLVQILTERGFAAWIELVVLTIVIVLPSFFSTKLLERLTANVFPKLNKWKSLFYSIIFTFIYYLILMAVLEPIKNV